MHTMNNVSVELSALLNIGSGYTSVHGLKTSIITCNAKKNRCAVYNGEQVLVFISKPSSRLWQLETEIDLEEFKKKKHGSWSFQFCPYNSSSHHDLLMGRCLNRIILWKFQDSKISLAGTFDCSSPNETSTSTKAIWTDINLLLVIQGRTLRWITPETKLNDNCSLSFSFQPTTPFWSSRTRELVTCDSSSNKFVRVRFETESGVEKDSGANIFLGNQKWIAQIGQMEAMNCGYSRAGGALGSGKGNEEIRWACEQTGTQQHRWIGFIESWSQSLTSSIMSIKPNMRSVGFENSLNLVPNFSHDEPNSANLPPNDDLVSSSGGVLDSLMNITQSTHPKPSPLVCSVIDGSSSVLQGATRTQQEDGLMEMTAHVARNNKESRAIKALGEVGESNSPSTNHSLAARLFVLQSDTEEDTTMKKAAELKLPVGWNHLDVVGFCSLHELVIVGRKTASTVLIVQCPKDSDPTLIQQFELPTHAQKIIGACATCKTSGTTNCSMTILLQEVKKVTSQGAKGEDKNSSESAAPPTFFFGGVKEHTLHLGVLEIKTHRAAIDRTGLSLGHAMNDLRDYLSSRFNRIEDMLVSQGKRIDNLEGLLNTRSS